MCGCQDSFVCSRCAGDPRQDYRLAFQPDPAEDRDDREREADRERWLNTLTAKVTR